MSVGMKQGGILQGLLQPMSSLEGWPVRLTGCPGETGQLSRETRMDRVGSGVVDGMAGRE